MATQLTKKIAGVPPQQGPPAATDTVRGVVSTSPLARAETLLDAAASGVAPTAPQVPEAVTYPFLHALMAAFHRRTQVFLQPPVLPVKGMFLRTDGTGRLEGTPTIPYSLVDGVPDVLPQNVNDRGGKWGGDYPTSGGSGLAGAIMRGDFWSLNGPAQVSLQEYPAKSLMMAAKDNPAQIPADWIMIEPTVLPYPNKFRTEDFLSDGGLGHWNWYNQENKTTWDGGLLVGSGTGDYATAYLNTGGAASPGRLADMDYCTFSFKVLTPTNFFAVFALTLDGTDYGASNKMGFVVETGQNVKVFNRRQGATESLQVLTAPQTALVNLSAENKVSIRYIGNGIKFFINGEDVHTFYEPTFDTATDMAVRITFGKNTTAATDAAAKQLKINRITFKLQ